MKNKLSLEARVALVLFTAGRAELTPLDIAEHISSNAPKWMKSNGEFNTYEWGTRIRAKLRTIRDEIQEETVLCLHTVSEHYFWDLQYAKVDLDNPIKYIPKGRYYQLGGLRKVLNKKDPIYLASLGLSAEYLLKRDSKIGNRAVRAYQLKMITGDHLEALIQLQYQSFIMIADGNSFVDRPLINNLARRSKIQNP